VGLCLASFTRVARGIHRYALVLIALAQAVRCNSLERRDYLCEVAVARITECCPQLSPSSFLCVSTQGCYGPTSLPVLRTDESECILELDCAGIAEQHICEAVRTLPSASKEICPDGGDGRAPCRRIDDSVNRAPICH
jgi:hypothetical protein